MLDLYGLTAEEGVWSESNLDQVIETIQPSNKERKKGWSYCAY
jgi:hypothetical protein